LELPVSFPFTRLKLPGGERVLWYGYNPTFHRFRDYGIVLSDRALYLFGPAWLIGRWRRVPVDRIQSVEASRSLGQTMVALNTVAGVLRFHTPHDFYRDEMDFDAGVVQNLLGKLVESNAGIEVRGNVT
jgi:hypothetical protein